MWILSGIKRRSKVPGVMITQYIEELPEGMTTPDFTRKPIALTIQEGKLAIFKAKVFGNPAPTVTWHRAKGEMNNPQKFQNKYDPTTNEHTLEIPKVSGDEADTYKCYASNEYGKAVCTVVLNVIEVGFKKDKEMQKAEGTTAGDPTEFRKRLRRSAGKKAEKKEGDIDDSVWELLLSAEKKDYEHICIEYGITDFRGMLKKLVEMKKEREEEQAQFIQHLSNLKPIEVKSEEGATFELEMELKDPNSRIFLYKDGVMIPYSKDVEGELKHCLKQVGKKYIFTVKNLNPEDAGIYQVDVEGVNIFSTDFKVPPVDFALKIKEVTAQEREDAIFECVLTQPISKMVWNLKNTPLFNNDKYEITCSEDKLIHCLRIVDCMPLDAGIYAAIAGIKSCSAWLIVEADKDPATKGKKKAQKFTLNIPESKTCILESPPRFMVPLKIHTAPQGYECYMSCAVRGKPTPHVTWYRNNVSLNTDTNYYITNTCGVCSMLILRVGAKDMGEYKVIAESSLGRAECTTNLTVRGKVLHEEIYTIKHLMTAGFPKALSTILEVVLYL
uniref:Immunoglobulin like and fibronectin type III domain containing 1, tandem duplicate 1 n=1 Tax=Sinocyclocheilus rhinocerous TaxID=307959 RepID=A0A673M6F5_9TELE